MRQVSALLARLVLYVFAVCAAPLAALAQAAWIEVHNETNATISVYTENLATTITGHDVIEIPPISVGLVPIPNAGRTLITYVAQRMQTPLVHEEVLIANTGGRYSTEIFAASFGVTAMFDVPAFDTPQEASYSGQYWFNDGWTGWMAITQDGTSVEGSYGNGRGSLAGTLTGNILVGTYFWDLGSTSPVTGDVQLEFSESQVCGRYQRDGAASSSDWGCGARETE